MEHHIHRLALTTAATLLFCAYVTVALPAARVDSVRGDLTQLANLIHRLKHLDNADNDDDDAWAALSRKDEDLSPHGTGPADSPASAAADKLSALRQGFLGFNKRQGSWSYDYGLGGGRFGKRYYGDYGIGGGRFGRDVDHVDIADTNDVTL